MPPSPAISETVSYQSRLGKYSVVQTETLGGGLVNLGLLLEDPESIRCACVSEGIWSRSEAKRPGRSERLGGRPGAKSSRAGRGKIVRVPGRHAVRRHSHHGSRRSAGVGFRPRARPAVSEERPEQRPRIPYSSAEILAAGGRREISRKPGSHGGRLDRGAGRLAPGARYVRG